MKQTEYSTFLEKLQAHLDSVEELITKHDLEFYGNQRVGLALAIIQWATKVGNQILPPR